MKKLSLFLMCFCLLAVCAKISFTQEAADPSAKNKTDISKLTAKAAADKIIEWDKKLKSLSFNYTQTLKSGDVDMAEQITARLRFKAPNLVRLDYLTPQEQNMYTDKKNILVYKPADNYALNADWNTWVKTNSGSFAGLLDFGNYSSLLEKYDISLDKKVNGFIKLDLTPKAKNESYTVSLYLGTEDFFPRQIIASVQDIVIDTKIYDVQKDAPIEDSVFKFIAPPDLPVLEF